MMARKRSSVKPATFALAMSTLGPDWAKRLESRDGLRDGNCTLGMFKRAARCHEAGGVFASLLCLIGLSI
jgi:hypothetical protein